MLHPKYFEVVLNLATLIKFGSLPKHGCIECTESDLRPSRLPQSQSNSSRKPPVTKAHALTRPVFVTAGTRLRSQTKFGIYIAKKPYESMFPTEIPPKCPCRTPIILRFSWVLSPIPKLAHAMMHCTESDLHGFRKVNSSIRPQRHKSTHSDTPRFCDCGDPPEVTNQIRDLHCQKTIRFHVHHQTSLLNVHAAP